MILVILTLCAIDNGRRWILCPILQPVFCADPDKIDQDLFLDSETAEGSGGGVETKTVSPRKS